MQRTYWKITALLLFLLILAPFAPARAAAQDSDALMQLLDSAEYWKQRGRTDKVVEIWEKILRSNPNHVPTLVNLAAHYANAGNQAKTDEVLVRLEQASPGHPSIDRLRQSLQQGPISNDALAQARSLAQSGRHAQAVEQYRKLFAGRVPSGPIALEFYQTLGGAPGGWAEARQGMERLVAENPGNRGIELALAKHLTYEEGERREGIARLASLASDPSVGSSAQSAWRKALLWLGASIADGKLYEAYLTAVGEDAEVRERLDKVRALSGSGDAGPDRLDEGYKALDEQNVQAADEAFQWALTRRGKNVDAVVGLALVEMKRENFTAARALLEEARNLAPNQPEKWEQSLASARFWEMIGQAREKEKQGRFQEAESLLIQAGEISPAEAVHARLELGYLYQNRHSPAQAADQFRAVLEKDPNQADALFAMVQVMLKEGQKEAALIFNKRLAQVDPARALPPERIESEAMRYQAAFQRGIADDAQARFLLEEAARIDPANPWVRFDLVMLYKETGHADEAGRLLDQLLAENPNRPQFIMAEALLLASQGKYTRALERVNSIPEDRADGSVARLRQRLEVQIQASTAVRGARSGANIHAARFRLGQLQAEVHNDPELLALVGIAWADIGENDRGLTLVRSAVARTQPNNPDIQLQLASILLRADRHEEMLALLAEIRANSELTPRQIQDVFDLRIAYAVRRADQAREAGNFDLAYSYLTPSLREKPDNPRLMNATGRLLYSGGNFEESEAVFLQVLLRNPDDLEALQGAAFASSKLGKKSQAKRLLKEAEKNNPGDPRISLIAGRAALMTGNDAKAMRHFRKALDQDRAWAETETRPIGYGWQTESASLDSNENPIARILAQQQAESSGAGEAAAKPLQKEIMQEINNVKSRYRTRLGLTGHVRYREGESGMSRLTELKAPLETSIPAGYAGRVEFSASPVYLDAGKLDLDDPFTAERFGAYGIAPYTGDSDEKIQREIGGELELGYRYRGYGVYVGSTPIGAPIETVTGRILLGDQINNFGFKLDLKRKAVQDSLLSYVGVKDPTMEKTWGGVTENGGRLDLSVSKRPVLLYAFGGYHLLLGQHVSQNDKWQGGAGLQWTLYDQNDMQVTTGLSGSALGYNENQRYFTFGHGGYFSPQFFVNGGIPIFFTGRRGPVGFLVDGLVGINWYREDKADYFPEDDDLQALRETMTDNRGNPVDSAHDSLDGALSFALNAGGGLSYLFTPQLEMMVSFHVYTAEEYNEYIGRLGMVYIFGKPPGKPVPTIPEIPQ